MKIHKVNTIVKTRERISIENISDCVARHVVDHGVGDGFVLVSVPHTTCALTVNEDEPGLREDIRRMASRFLEPLAAESAFAHDLVDDNAQAHLTSILFGHSVQLPLDGSRLGLGRWQSILLIELDGPRNRTVNIQIMGN